MSFRAIMSCEKYFYIQQTHQKQFHLHAVRHIYPLNRNKSNRMGKGVSWSAKERECAALAWFRATNNSTVRADQRLEDFQNQIFSIFKVLAPTTSAV
jgi:hypothetical protein